MSVKLFVKPILILLPLCLLCISASGQNAKKTINVPGSIVVLECLECPDVVESLPEVSYPAYLGYGPHVYSGVNGVMIDIEKDGSVSSAKAISGHPYFRKMLEDYSLGARFRETEERSKAVLQFRITSPKEIRTGKESIINLSSRSVVAKPIFTTALKDDCASGDVVVSVGAKGGSAFAALPVSGDPLLFPYAASAAFRSKLPADSTSGRLTIRFPHDTNCKYVGELNRKIVSMPLPTNFQHYRALGEVEVDIRVVLNNLGQVISTRALNGHPILRGFLQASVRDAKFKPGTTAAEGVVNTVGIIKFRVSDNHKVRY